MSTLFIPGTAGLESPAGRQAGKDVDRRVRDASNATIDSRPECQNVAHPAR